MARRGRRRWSWVAYLALAAVALGNAGCLVAAAAGAAGGVAGYAYYKGKVSRTYPANVEDVRAAARAALTDLQMPVVSDEPGPKGGKIESRAGDDTISISLELEDSPIPNEGPVTLVGVRVATFGNEVLSERVLDQIGYHLAPPNRVAPPPLLINPPPGVTPGPPAAPPQTGPPPLAK